MSELKIAHTPRKEIIDEVAKQLTPVFSDYCSNTKQYQLYQKYKKQFQQEDQRIQEALTNHFNLIKNFKSGINEGINNSTVSGNPVNQSLFLYAITYLLETELMGTACIDRVLLLLIGKEVDIHLEPDIQHRYTRHAKCLEDLQTPSLSLANKQDFLATNDITLFSKMIDRHLRNSIAHSTYTIENNQFYYRSGSKKKQANLSDKLHILTEYYDAIKKFFNEQEKKAGYK
jgi:hypothetical protein